MSDVAVIARPPIIKPRVSVELTAAVANALADCIMWDTPLFPTDGRLQVNIEGSIVEIPRGTLNSWITRVSVIPETGHSLRDALDEAREERKRVIVEQRQASIVETAEVALAEIVKLPITTTTKRKSFGFDRETGERYQRGESEETGIDAKLADVKVKGLTFALERLNPTRYSPKLETKNTHLVFSLSDLRRAKERRDEFVGVPGVG